MIDTKALARQAATQVRMALGYESTLPENAVRHFKAALEELEQAQVSLPDIPPEISTLRVVRRPRSNGDTSTGKVLNRLHEGHRPTQVRLEERYAKRS